MNVLPDGGVITPLLKEGHILPDGSVAAVTSVLVSFA